MATAAASGLVSRQGSASEERPGCSKSSCAEVPVLMVFGGCMGAIVAMEVVLKADPKCAGCNELCMQKEMCQLWSIH